MYSNCYDFTRIETEPVASSVCTLREKACQQKEHSGTEKPYTQLPWQRDREPRTTATRESNQTKGLALFLPVFDVLCYHLR